MPDAAVAEPPASAAQEPTTIEKLAADFDKLPPAEDSKPDAVPEKPALKAKTDAAPKPADKPTEKTAEKPKTDAAPKVEAGKPAPKLYEAHEALKKRVSSELEPELTRLKTENAELKVKAETPANSKELEEARKEVERLSGELREASFERSPEYKQQFLERRDAIYKEAVEEVSGLTVTLRKNNPETGEVETSERPATAQDFRAIYQLPPREQDRALVDMFGPSAPRVASYIADLRRNARDAEAAISKARESGATKERESAERTKAEEKKYQQSRDDAQKYLESQYPQWFKMAPVEGEGADKELAAAHQSGYDLVDTYVNKGPTLPIEDRAAYAATVRARAAAFPRLVLENRRLADELKTMKGRVTAKEDSDPGAGGEGGEKADERKAGDNVPKGIEAAAAKFDQ